ncbi:acriflavin resistance protein [Oribacterium sp. C9]|uniref:efflux RND transporter permease subunit n=1 Tax=Oribacterium sp. C9 TaxID=1943579 RepID=UPI00099008C3|nr:efflux RND transporter permease subunit [Oribacterium sp. C9]OON88343.1 acriflavin resistance protein [Oribacterium sp. C9]
MHKITEFVIRRPVTTILVVISLIFFGIMSLLNQKMELMSDINVPMIIITTTYNGASPEDVDEIISTPIEEGVSVLSDVKRVTSKSSENYGFTMVRYEYGTDMDKAYDDMKKKIDSIKAGFPEGVKEPNILTMNVSEQPSLSLSIENSAQDNMYNYVENDISPEFESLGTVASVSISGGQKQYVSIELIPEKLKQYNLSMSTVASTVGAADFAQPAGTTNVGKQKLSVSTGNDYDDVNSLGNIPITTGNGNTVYLSDIARINLSLKDRDAIGRFNGQDTIMLDLTKKQSESAVNMSNQAKNLIADLESRDENLKIHIIDDDSDSILSSLTSVFETMIMAIIISMIVIILFFGDLKASLIVGTSIPLSILTALVAMWAMGYSLNMVTMSALVLGVGMMVDNSIVVLEACFRAMDKYSTGGLKSRQTAALDSVKTVGESVLGSTITTCVVFLPLGFMSGLMGQFFAPLGFTIVFCMLSSLVSAISIVPLCFVLYKPSENSKAPAHSAIQRMQVLYRGIIDKLLNHRVLVLVISVALFIASLGFLKYIRVEMMPATDDGKITIDVSTRAGLKIDEIDNILLKIEDVVAKDPDTKNYRVSSGGSSIQSMYYGSSSTVSVELIKNRSMKTKDKATYYRKLFDGTPDAVISVTADNSMSGLSTAKETYEVILQSSNYNNLKQASKDIVEELQHRNDVTAVHSSLENAAPLIKVHVDPIKAGAEGLTPSGVGTQLYNMISGKKAMTMQIDGQNTDVTVEYPKDEYDDVEKIKDIFVTSPSGTQVQLKDISDVVFEDSPASISRENKKYNVTITADYTTNADQMSRMRINNEVISKYLNSGVTMGMNSSDQSQNEEFSAFGGALVIAVFLIWVVMASQFESMRFSFMVMTTLPLALIGSFALLWLTDSSISMVSLLGFMMLIGTVVNNGILYVDTVNQYRMAMPKRRALIEAGATRLRPILMTTLTTVLSMIPMAIGIGDNGEMMKGLAIVDVGGLTASTILALLVLPVYYTVMDKSKKMVDRDVPAPGYMEGKKPSEYYQKKAAEDWERYGAADDDPTPDDETDVDAGDFSDGFPD